MSTTNTIAPGAREAERSAEERDEAKRQFEIPPDVEKRFTVRVIEGTTGEKERIGLFRPGEAEPAIEVRHGHLVAHREEREVIEALVKIAQHNGWKHIDVEGTPEFRKAIWQEASRAGLTVKGYEPSFAEQQEMAAYRREAARDGAAEAAPAAAAKPERPNIDQGVEGVIVAIGEARYDSKATKDTPFVDVKLADGRQERAWRVGLPDALEQSVKSVGDAVMLKRLGVEPVEVSVPVADRESGETTQEARTVRRNRWLAEDAPPLQPQARDEPPAPDRGADASRAGAVIATMEAVAATASESAATATNTQSVSQPSGAEASDAADGMASERDVERIFEHLVRTLEERGDPRATAVRETATALANQLAAEREDSDVARSLGERNAAAHDHAHASPAHDEAAHAPADHRGARDELAELFLHGAAEVIAADPRLAGARAAQTAMELHIAEVFKGEPTQILAANFESRTLISAALQNGRDVSVQESPPVRQIEPIHPPTPAMER
jgi:hypothetical protein